MEVKVDGKEEEEEQEVINPRLSEESSGRASNSLSSLGQPEPWPTYSSPRGPSSGPRGPG